MKKLSIIFLSIFLFSLGTTVAQNSFRGFRDDCIRESKLNLSDEQKEKFSELRLSHRENVIDLRAKLEKNRIEKRRLMNADNLDKEKILSLVEENNRIKGEIQKSRVEMLLKMRELLTDEQKEKLGNNFCNDFKRKKHKRFNKKSNRNFKKF